MARTPYDGLRYPLDVLDIALACTTETNRRRQVDRPTARLAELLGVCRRSAARYRARGWLTEDQAETAAVNLGAHPRDLWSRWGCDAELLEGSVR